MASPKMRSSFLATLIILCTYFVPLYAWPLGPFSYFKTQPTFEACSIDIKQNIDHKKLAPGYIFITPYVSDYRAGSYGPQIFDQQGTLVWYGNETAKIRAMDAHVCDYLGERGNHICYNDASPVEQHAHSAGLIRFFNNHYEQVGPDFAAAGGLRMPDIHELHTPPSEEHVGETFIQDVYEVKDMDLTDYLGPKDGKVLDGCFQEISLRNGSVMFQWCALDHMPVWDTYMFLWGKKDQGSTNYSRPVCGYGIPRAPWDFFHINSIGKNYEGDYIVSARHLNTIFKIAGDPNRHGVKPGTILWRLGGKHNDFEMHGFNFSKQHHVRFRATTKDITMLTMFDNAHDGWAFSAKYSTGKLIALNNETMQAYLVQQYDPPEKKLSFSQGSFQTLDNGNVLIGWGNRPFCSEYTHNGTLLWHMKYEGNVESFRCWKFPWVGLPNTKPKILPYCVDWDPNQRKSLYAYISWNGATEVTNYEFYTSSSTSRGPWNYVGTFTKTYFETAVNLSSYDGSGFAPWVKAVALDKEGVVLGTSEATETFVPARQIRYVCDETSCDAKRFKYDYKYSIGSEAPRDLTTAKWIAAVLFCTIEAATWAMSLFLDFALGHRFISFGKPTVYANGSKFYRDRQGRKIFRTLVDTPAYFKAAAQSAIPMFYGFEKT